MLVRSDSDHETFPKPQTFGRVDTMSFTNTLGKSEWEAVATYCIYKAQRAGVWTPVKLRAGRIIAEMIAADLLVFAGRTGHLLWAGDTYCLTKKALHYIANPGSWRDAPLRS